MVTSIKAELDRIFERYMDPPETAIIEDVQLMRQDIFLLYGMVLALSPTPEKGGNRP